MVGPVERTSAAPGALLLCEARAVLAWSGQGAAGHSSELLKLALKTMAARNVYHIVYVKEGV